MKRRFLPTRDTRHVAGELPQAREAWQQALAIFEESQHPDTEKVRDKPASAGPADRVQTKPGCEQVVGRSGIGTAKASGVVKPSFH